MKRWIVAGAVLLAVLPSCFAGFSSGIQFGSGDGFSTGSGVPPVSFSLTYGSASTSTATTTTIDFGTLTYGSGCTRVIAANIYHINNVSSTTITGITIGGTALAQVAGAANNANGVTSVGSDVWESTASLAGSSGDVQVTYSNTPNPFSSPSRVALYCLVTTTPAASSANNANVSFGNPISISSFVVPTGGGAIVFTAGANASVLNTLTNATQDDGTGQFYFEHASSTGTLTFTGTYAGSDSLVMSAVAWGP